MSDDRVDRNCLENLIQKGEHCSEIPQRGLRVFPNRVDQKRGSVPGVRLGSIYLDTAFEVRQPTRGSFGRPRRGGSSRRGTLNTCFLKAAGFCSIAREKSNFRRTAINLLPQVTRCRLAESYYFWPAPIKLASFLFPGSPLKCTQDSFGRAQTGPWVPASPWASS